MSEPNPLGLPEPETADALAKQVVELKNLLQELKDVAAPLEAEKSKFKEEAKIYDDLARAARDKANAVEIKMFDLRKSIRQAEKDAQQAVRKLEQQQKVELAEREFLKIAADYDEIVANAPWFSDAMPHQFDAAKRMAYEGTCILADTMGLGKTLTVIAALDMAQAKKVLVVVPVTVLKSFENEIKRWAPHRKNILPVGAMPKAQRNFALDLAKDLDECIVIINYEAWRKDKQLLDTLVDVNFDTIILDEAHNIKDKKTKAYEGVMSIINGLTVRDEVMSMDEQGNTYVSIETVRPRVYPMTGTPILNKPQELYPLLNLVDPDSFSSEYYFLRDYCQKNYYTDKWEFAPGGLARLSQKIANKFIRRTKESAGIKLPEKTIQVHEVELTAETHPEQYEASRQMNQQAMIILDEEEGKFIAATMVLELILRKRQLMTWPAGIQIKDKDGSVLLKVDVEQSAKIDYIIRPNGPDNSYADAEGLLPEVVGDEKVVIFSQFKAPLHELQRRCEQSGIRSVILDGDVPREVRDQQIELFQNTPVGDPNGVDVIIANYKAMGIGVTLHAASQMIILDEEWSPGRRDQAYDRIHRIGQDKPVTIHVLRVAGSIDTWMAGLIDEKEAMIGGFVENVDMVQRLRDALRDGLL